MGLSEEIRQQLINSFQTEQSEHVQKINEGLLALEKNPTGEARQALLDDIFREAHSLKGAARAVGMTIIESLGHNLEDLLLNAKDGQLAFSPKLFDLLYQALDAVELMMSQLNNGQSSPDSRKLRHHRHAAQSLLGASQRLGFFSNCQRSHGGFRRLHGGDRRWPDQYAIGKRQFYP